MNSLVSSSRPTVATPPPPEKTSPLAVASAHSARSTTPAQDSPRYGRLRACRYPHSAAAALAHHLGHDAAELATLAPDALTDEGQLLLPSGASLVPSGARRFPLAQRSWSELHGASTLFSKSGRSLTTADFVLAHYVAQRNNWLPADHTRQPGCERRL